ncbi:hypothetical protein HKD37_04G009796 [Glycine soja]
MKVEEEGDKDDGDGDVGNDDSNGVDVNTNGEEQEDIASEKHDDIDVPEFNQNLARVKALNIKAWEYLKKWPKEAWTKAYYSEWCKVDNICNNTCEVFNSKIVTYRTKPILTMLEEFRCYIMRSMSDHKLKLAARSGPLCPMQQSRLDREKN